MKVGVIGSGGREHALCLSLKKSKEISQIYCFPGNAGTNQIAKNVEKLYVISLRCGDYSVLNNVDVYCIEQNIKICL